MDFNVILDHTMIKIHARVRLLFHKFLQRIKKKLIIKNTVV